MSVINVGKVKLVDWQTIMGHGEVEEDVGVGGCIAGIIWIRLIFHVHEILKLFTVGIII